MEDANCVMRSKFMSNIIADGPAGGKMALAHPASPSNGLGQVTNL
jgi:hypothetical protein